MRLRQYELLEKLGEGGMGIVYRALDRESNRLVAVKILASEVAKNPSLCARFKQEYAIGKRLSHPNLVQAFDYGVEGRPYLVMELIDGQSLAERIAAEGPLPEDEVLWIALQVAEGLKVAHQHDLIHRDVKPGNILLLPDGRAKLADLGLVKDLAISTGLTSFGCGLGTVVYVAPEQFENAILVCPSSDIYSLAATIYHALTGVPPFSGAVGVVVLKRKLCNEFVPPRVLVPTIQPGLDRAICQALESCPEKRQQSCDEFIASLGDPARLEAVRNRSSQAKTDRSPDHSGNRRRAFRFPSSAPIGCQPTTNSGEFQWGNLLDISLTGIQVRLAHPCETSNSIRLELLDRDNTVHILHARVCWTNSASDQSCTLGCSFEQPLTETQLNAILGNPGRTVFLRRSEHSCVR